MRRAPALLGRDGAGGGRLVAIAEASMNRIRRSMSSTIRNQRRKSNRSSRGITIRAAICMGVKKRQKR